MVRRCGRYCLGDCAVKSWQAGEGRFNAGMDRMTVEDWNEVLGVPKPRGTCTHGLLTCGMCFWVCGMTEQDYVASAGPYSKYKVAGLTPRHALAPVFEASRIPVPQSPRPRIPQPPPGRVHGSAPAWTLPARPSAFRRVLSSMPELLLVWSMLWLERLLPEDDD